jgi:hypothetical protein
VEMTERRESILCRANSGDSVSASCASFCSRARFRCIANASDALLLPTSDTALVLEKFIVRLRMVGFAGEPTGGVRGGEGILSISWGGRVPIM